MDYALLHIKVFHTRPDQRTVDTLHILREREQITGPFKENILQVLKTQKNPILRVIEQLRKAVGGAKSCIKYIYYISHIFIITDIS